MANPSKGIGPLDEQSSLIDNKGENYLLAIAIDQYQYLPPLFNPVRDAQAFIELMTDRYRFDEKNVIRIFNQEATEPKIFDAFRKLIEKITPDDNLVVYYSGHGEFDKVLDEGYWIPVNAHPGAFDEYMANDIIRRFISRINSHHTFLVSDSCFSGSLFSSGASKNVSKRYERDPSRWGLTAGRKEIVSDGKPGMHSPFADALLYRLRTSSEPLGVQELCSYVVEQVEANANQSPIGEPLKVDGHKNGQFVFHLKKDEARDWKDALETATPEGFRRYLAMYPAGAHAEEALWKTAEKSEDIAACIQYLDAYPKGAFQRLAEKRLAQLEDERDWQETRRTNTILAYRQYKGSHPQGAYHQEADKRMQALLSGSAPPPDPKPVTITKTIVVNTPAASKTGSFNKRILYIGLPIILVAVIIWALARGGGEGSKNELASLALDINSTWETLWNSADLSYENCHSYLPEYGIRGRYAAVKGKLNFAVLEKLTGEPVFLSGPHQGGEMVYSRYDDFGHYNPAFLNKLEKMVAGLVKNKEAVNQLQPFYDRQFKKYLQLYALSYQGFANQEDLVRKYNLFLSEGKPGNPLLQESVTYSQDMENSGYNGLEAFVIPSFWVRRTVDGTADEFYSLLTLVQKTFDPEFSAIK